MAAETLARFGANRDDALTVMTNGGGAGVLAADAAALAGVALHDLSDGDARAARRCAAARPGRTATRSTSSATHPPSATSTTLQALLDDRDAGAVLFLHAPTAIVRSDEHRARLRPDRAPGRRPRDGVLARRRSGRRGAAHLRGRRRRRLRDARGGGARVRDARDLPSQPGAAARGADRERERSARPRHDARGDRSARSPAAARCSTRSRRSRCSPPTASRPCALARSPPSADAAARAGSEIGYPVALKILSPDIEPQDRRRRRRARCRDERSCATRRKRCSPGSRAARPDARIEGFTVQQMVRRPLAQELIVGASDRSAVRPGAAVRPGRHRGRGRRRPRGRPAAAQPRARRASWSRAPASRSCWLAIATVRRRGSMRSCDALIGVSQMLADLPELAELDINPLLADDEGVLALDARIRLDRTPAGGRRALRDRTLSCRARALPPLARRADRCATDSSGRRGAARRVRRAALAVRPASALLLSPPRAAA